MKTMEAGEEHLGERPGLAAGEQDVEHEAGVDGVFGGVADFGGVENELLEVAELLCGALEALVDVNIITSIGGDPTAEVLEVVYYGDGRSNGVDDVRDAVVRARYCGG
jgi:hypothetical protein